MSWTISLENNNVMVFFGNVISPLGYTIRYQLVTYLHFYVEKFILSYTDCLKDLNDEAGIGRKELPKLNLVLKTFPR